MPDSPNEGQGRMEMSAKQWLLSTAALAGLGLAPVAAAAQNAPAPAGVVTPASTASGKLEEVVVTAERRASSAQKTPVSIEVFTAATLSKQGVHDVAALSAIAPSLNFNESAGLPTIGIRGITSNDVTETGDLAVLVANNGFFNSRAYALREGFYDVSRVEVLEGPQGTLFGRNAAGGVVNIIDNTPVDHYAGYASVQYGNYNDIETEGMANIPISPSLSARFSFLTQNHDGYIDEHLAGTYGQTQRGDDADNQSGRVVLQYHPSEDFNGVITMQYSKVGGIGDVRDEIPLTYDNSGACPGSASNNGCVVVNKMPVGVYKNGDTITANAPASQNATDKLLIWNLAYSALPYGITAS
jgi:iron complex outermembrane receptor protein